MLANRILKKAIKIKGHTRSPVCVNFSGGVSGSGVGSGMGFAGGSVGLGSTGSIGSVGGVVICVLVNTNVPPCLVRVTVYCSGTVFSVTVYCPLELKLCHVYRQLLFSESLTVSMMLPFFNSWTSIEFGRSVCSLSTQTFRTLRVMVLSSFPSGIVST